MILHRSENLSNLSTTKDLPEDIIRGLFVRYTGVAAGGVTVTLANCGQVRVNYRGSDIVNAPVAFLSTMNNLHWGVAEATSALGGAFAFSVYVPFHAPWDEQNGLVNRLADRGFVNLSFPAMTAAVIASGTVFIYYVKAKTVASYVPLWIQQNVQAGGAGIVVDRMQSFNISSLYVDFNAILTGSVLVYRDGECVVNSDQATLEAKSNFDNRVETALTAFQIDLNPNKLLENALANNIEVNFGVSGAGTLGVYYLAILYQQQAPGMVEVSNLGTPSKGPALVTKKYAAT
jgi:hypothetical protein